MAGTLVPESLLASLIREPPAVQRVSFYIFKVILQVVMRVTVRWQKAVLSGIPLGPGGLWSLGTLFTPVKVHVTLWGLLVSRFLLGCNALKGRDVACFVWLPGSHAEPGTQEAPVL